MLVFRHVLAIETSCDDTSVAIVRNDGTVISVVSANQDLAHQPFGGIVPEIASRNHTLQLLPLVEVALSKADMSWPQLDGLAVTSRPGLVGALMVGVVTAKTLALAYNKPFIGINHLEGHLVAPLLRDAQYHPPEGFTYPYVGLAISGGHTSLYYIEDFGRYRVLGQTVDDAAGEAFDKFAKIVGLGYPGGVQVDRWGQKGDPKKFSFPRAMLHEETFAMSFSGLKTAGQRQVELMDPAAVKEQMADLCASYQEAIVDVLVQRLARAVAATGIKRAILTGGVAANSRLRLRAQRWAQENTVELVVPPLRYCTDNAAMIGYAGILRLNRGERSGHDLGPLPKALPEDFLSVGELP